MTDDRPLFATLIQSINFTGNLDQLKDITIFFIIEETAETIFDFSQGAVRLL